MGEKREVQLEPDDWYESEGHVIITGKGHAMISHAWDTPLSRRITRELTRHAVDTGLAGQIFDALFPDREGET